MHQLLERQMTDAERERLLDCLPLAPSPFRSRDFKLKLVAEGIGVTLAVVILVWFQKQPAAFVIPAALGCYSLWSLLHLKSRVLSPLRRWREANQRVSEFRNAVAATQTVRVHCVEADAVVQVVHDEGTVCLFDIGPGQTYWIDPHEMLPGRPPADWPNRKFEVIELPGWKGEVGPFCYGKLLRARETLEFRDLFEHYENEPPADGLINQSLDAFLSQAKDRNQAGGAPAAWA